MYSVVQIGGHQYEVKAGDLLDVQKLEAEVGQEIEIDQVLFVGGENPQIGKPVVTGASVTAKVIRQARDRKIIIFKRRPGAWRKKNGHRQYYTGLLITEIKDGQGQSVKVDSESKVAKKYLK